MNVFSYHCPSQQSKILCLELDLYQLGRLPSYQANSHTIGIYHSQSWYAWIVVSKDPSGYERIRLPSAAAQLLLSSQFWSYMSWWGLMGKDPPGKKNLSCILLLSDRLSHSYLRNKISSPCMWSLAPPRISSWDPHTRSWPLRGPRKYWPILPQHFH